jgi:ribosomal protein L35AE/L33A
MSKTKPNSTWAKDVLVCTKPKQNKKKKISDSWRQTQQNQSNLGKGKVTGAHGNSGTVECQTLKQPSSPRLLEAESMGS